MYASTLHSETDVLTKMYCIDIGIHGMNTCQTSNI